MDWKWLFFSFEGRANRAKWWLSVLVFLVLSILIAFIVLPFLGLSVWEVHPDATRGFISLVIMIIFAWPVTAMTVKRLKDRDRPLWLAGVFWLPSILSIFADLLGLSNTTIEIGGQATMVPTTLGLVVSLVSLVIAIWSLIELGCLRGTAGPNQYGPDPLGRA
jgi:uncharacterized membrane protein YhaH (DUF805 family)